MNVRLGREFFSFQFAQTRLWNGMVLRNTVPMQLEGLPPTIPGPMVVGNQKKARLCTSGGHLGYSVIQKPRCRSLPVTSSIVSDVQRTCAT